MTNQKNSEDFAAACNQKLATGKLLHHVRQWEMGWQAFDTGKTKRKPKNAEEFSDELFELFKIEQQFEKWLQEQDLAPYPAIVWDIPEMVLQGYILAWADSVDIIFEIQYERTSRQYFGNLLHKGLRIDISGMFRSRQAATKEAILKIQEIFQ